jgi:hypothetical protein
MTTAKSVACLFGQTLRLIETGPSGKPTAWQRHQLYYTIMAINAGDFEAAANQLRSIGEVPGADSWERIPPAVWRAPRFTMKGLVAYHKALQAALV